jgi:paraquat-inducible protein B
VTINVYPNRMRARYVPGTEGPGDSDAANRELVDRLAANGLRAQLRTGNLLTEQLYVALDFHPEAAPAKVDWSRTPPILPSIGGGLEEIQETVARILRKLDRLPIDGLVADADGLVKKVDHDLAPQVSATLEEARKAAASAQRLLAADAPVQQDLRDALLQLQRSARALRTLTEELEAHPESLLRGRPEERR